MMSLNIELFKCIIVRPLTQQHPHLPKKISDLDIHLIKYILVGIERIFKKCIADNTVLTLMVYRRQIWVLVLFLPCFE